MQNASEILLKQYLILTKLAKRKEKKMKKCFTVWVGGVEVNDYLLSRSEAVALADSYKQDGYDDVSVQKNLKNDEYKSNKH